MYGRGMFSKWHLYVPFPLSLILWLQKPSHDRDDHHQVCNNLVVNQPSNLVILDLAMTLKKFAVIWQYP